MMFEPQEPPNLEAVLENRIRDHEMEITGDLLRRSVDEHPELQRENGRLMVGYGAQGVWLSVAGVTVASVIKARWWDMGLDSREDRVSELTAELIRTLSPRT